MKLHWIEEPWSTPQVVIGAALIGSQVFSQPTIPAPLSASLTVVSATGAQFYLPAALGAITEDIADRDVTLRDLAVWAKSMRGGDTSRMLDV